MSVQSLPRRWESEAAGSGMALLLLFLWVVSTMSLWFFAFYAMPAETPDWVRRAQVACFGSDGSGLPGPSGWMLLVLSPLLFLVAIIIGLGAEVRTALSALRASLTGMLALSVVTLGMIIETSWVASSISERLELSQGAELRTDPLHLPSHYPRSRERAPDFNLVDQRGERRNLASFSGKPVFFSFVFAHCQTVCPSLVTTVTKAVSEIGADKVGAVFITLDPWRDTPGSLPSLARQWKLGEGISLLSGMPEEVEASLNAYGVPRERDQQSGDVAHPALVYVLSPTGERAYSFNNPSIEWLKEAATRVRE